MMQYRRAVILHNGFTMIEVLIALFVLAVALLSLMSLNSSSNRGAMDAYFELIGMQLAQEPIEIFQAFGYEWVEAYRDNLTDYPISQWKDIPVSPLRPVEATLFQRRIELEQIQNDNGVSFYKIRVLVAPKGENRVKNWLSRAEISMEAMIVERPK
ncbi:MAG: prepilin-type N-terminal cleavage/methylation domain-containing protein [Candidatus Riflebacteria bacterium]|nr:prepilin-type N-terminal cleavage/methylation domain-containing protein [Candidatus Riflebacteria bacterium]